MRLSEYLVGVHYELIGSANTNTHFPTFIYGAFHNSECLGQGDGRSKAIAKENAAENAIK